MSVIYLGNQGGGNSNNGGKTLSTIGTLATLAGTFIPGMQWLTPLGTGLSTVGSALGGGGSGSGGSSSGGMSDLLKKMGEQILGKWLNPGAKNTNIARVNTSGTDNAEELLRRWAPYAGNMTGVNW